ncbi:Gfo/Idh/MocA family oxidoreductase [bacterium]|jgi:hypothetical protein|nr:Gfo/Idh/MocA family oxidoreductase [bacterium]
MRILFLGYSNLFQNELIPVINNLLEINEVHIAKFKNQEWNINHHKIVGKRVVLYPSYEEALKFANVDIAYITTVNSSHYELAKACLLKGWHTIVDQPITLSLNETEDLIKISKDLNCVLAESLVYLYHPQYNIIKRELKKFKIKSVLTELYSSYEGYNFRYNKELGGGAINDMGPYIVSIGRYLFNEEPIDIKTAIIAKRNDTNISFNIIMTYSEDRKLFGFFGFIADNVNFLNIMSSEYQIKSESAYITSEDLEPKIQLISHNKESVIISKSANVFELFFKDVFDAIKLNDIKRFHDTILMDSKTLQQLRNIK